MWYKDGSELVGERLPQLLIPEVHLVDRGAYHCIVFGREGNITSNVAFLNIRGGSVFTWHITPEDGNYVAIFCMQVSCSTPPTLSSVLLLKTVKRQNQRHRCQG